jgi:aminoglycoside/choline kinase family phosphotransferase
MISNDKLFIIDFQDALTGPKVYDLVSLLNDSYVDIPEDMQFNLIKRYSERTNSDFENIFKEFNIVTVQRKLKDAGRFIYIDRVKNDPSFLPFFDKSLNRVKNALDKLQGLDSLKEALAKADPSHFA